ncbi:MAG: hypothetical protein H6741_19045 [Alphaproteobacteria bacterium]|nr:hypothetical protein [Alphaproteobacteria bacterium]
MLEKVAQAIAEEGLSDDALRQGLLALAATEEEAAWVIIGEALGTLGGSWGPRLELGSEVIAGAGVWTASDIIGERVAGVCLMDDLHEALGLLTPWRDNASPWVRRALGAGVHRWAKRRAPEEEGELVCGVLSFLAPVAGEADPEALRGLGWGVKTIARFHPGLVMDWLLARREEGVALRALMVSKALTYMPEDIRRRWSGP